jgi:CheY-like chemotaxis protein
MNVVQSVVRRLTGSIRIHSEKGVGTRFILSIPVSIAVQHALMFRMGSMRFGMLTHMVEQALPLHQQDIQTGVGGKAFITYGKHQVPVVDMRAVLSGDNDSLSVAPSVIIAEHIEGYVGIVVDELMDDIEIMVRDLDPYIKRYQPQGLMGNTIAADGTVIMLLEPYGIKEMGRTSPDQGIEIDVAEEDKMRYRILLVDDSLIAREIEKRLFESIGFTVDTAIDGIDGIEKLESEHYDMVITDLEMPRLDGFGFARHIRNQAKYEDLPLMVISTRESAEDRLRALESGADTYMVKQQLNGDEILKTVQTLVGPLKQEA